MRTGKIAALFGAAAVVLSLAPEVVGQTERLSVSGVILAVDLADETMTIDDPASGEITFEVPEEAKIIVDGEAGGIIDDLFAGDLVKSARLARDNRGELYLIEAVVVSPETDP